ncbi:MAG: PDZ domain-containing protein [Pseudomonadota bacterium]
MHARCLALFSLLFMGLVQAQDSASSTRMLSQPDLSANHLAFVYAGDLYVAVRAEDGTIFQPRRLTTAPADERNPIFSPDGSQLAFRANYGNNADVYVIDIAGGQPRRLTYHPGTDVPDGWTPDGSEVAFFSGRESDHGRSGKLFHASLNGGLPQKQMDARYFSGAYDATGERLAYIDHGSGYNGIFGGSAGWKGYRGGTTPSIRILDIDDQTIVDIPGERVTDFNIFWLNGDVYFLSDRNDKQFNVFRFDTDTGQIDQITNETDWDVLSAAGHGNEIVYEAGGELKMINASGGDARTLDIRLNPDLPQLRTDWSSAASNIQAVDISPNGKRAIVTARGEVFTVPAENGPTRNLSDSAGVREYGSIWSPAGDQVAWIVESLSGQTLVVADQNGEVISTFELGPHFYDLEAWHADSGRIVFTDNQLGLYVIDLDDGDIDTIATNARRAGFDVSFSADGRWLAYSWERLNFHADLVVYDFDAGESTVISNGLADVASPAFSPDGEYLYFAASTNSGPIQVGLNMTSQERPYRAGLYAVVLKADGSTPLGPKSDDEVVESDEEGSDEDEAEEEDSAGDVEVQIDFDGIGQRIVGLPVASGNYGNLQVAGDGALFYIESPQPGASVLPPGENNLSERQLKRFDFEAREANTAFAGVLGFQIAASGEKMILQTASGLAMADVGESIEPEPVDLSGVRLLIDPRVEWAQIFDEGWRMQKEYFYAPNLHGLDWDAVYEQYRPLVDHVGRREDLNTLMVRMIAELHAGHNRVGGGDVHSESDIGTGLLGANFEIDNNRYRITKIYTGEDWNPYLQGPLAEPGNHAEVGEYILAINGQELTAADNIYQQLENTVDEQITLTVGPDADGDEARDIVITPTDSEFALRLWSWIESNRQAVAEATDGRVGYIYLPNTAGAGYTFFNRMFFSQIDKEAIIIDERSNGGGQAANYITEVLSRPHLSSWVDFAGTPFNTPAGALHGPKVMLIDQDAGSGGDYLPYSFRQLGIGPLIGTRTWGGLIGIFTNPLLVDGGVMTVPFFRFVDADGNWTIENEGVAPDIEVKLDPIATNNGRDTQLERAIEEILDRLETYESPVPPIPPLPTELGK